MATWDDVRRIALALPEVTERPSYDTRPAWRVKDKAFAWDRPLRGAGVPDLGAKEALLADNPAVYFTTPHFDGHPSILARLTRIGTDELTELLTEAWLSRAPKRLAKQFEADR